MAQILVRNLDPDVVERLKKRAHASGRSLQSEVKGILEDATRADYDRARKVANQIRCKLGDKTFSNSVDLIREDRDR